jgi:predicted RNA-binding protein YlxR (DUF448 family)
VSGKPAKPTKHIPHRTCVGCRTVLPKRSLVRLVRRPDGVQVDLSGKLTGRGAYLHNCRSCWEKGIKGLLAHALRTTLTAADLQNLRQYMQSIPENNEHTGELGKGPDGLMHG